MKDYNLQHVGSVSNVGFQQLIIFLFLKRVNLFLLSHEMKCDWVARREGIKKTVGVWWGREICHNPCRREAEMTLFKF